MSLRATHGELSDRALRRIRDALAPLADVIADAAGMPGGEPVHVSASPSVWAILHNALQDAEVWPLELLGPVSVWGQDEHGKRVMQPAWFTRGWHNFHRFALYARGQTRTLVGGQLVMREVPITTEMYWSWWAPGDPTKGRDTWTPVSAADPDSVPVTVWVNPARRTS